MAKDGYRRPFRKWIAQVFDKGPIIMLHGAILGAVSGVGLSTLDDNSHWDASSVPAKTEAIFTQAIDQKFSDVSDLKAEKYDIFVAQETAKFNEDMGALKELGTKAFLIDQAIGSKGIYIADKLLHTSGISEQNAARYVEQFNQAGLGKASRTDLSEVNMQFRNECFEEASFTTCAIEKSLTADMKDSKQLVGLGMSGVVLFFLISAIGGSTRDNRSWGNKWNNLDDVPTLKTKIKGVLEQKKRPKPSN